MNEFETISDGHMAGVVAAKHRSGMIKPRKKAMDLNL